jgi:hypothetical protein
VSVFFEHARTAQKRFKHLWEGGWIASQWPELAYDGGERGPTYHRLTSKGLDAVLPPGWRWRRTPYPLSVVRAIPASFQAPQPYQPVGAHHSQLWTLSLPGDSSQRTLNSQDT